MRLYYTTSVALLYWWTSFEFQLFFSADKQADIAWIYHGSFMTKNEVQQLHVPAILVTIFKNEKIIIVTLLSIFFSLIS